MHLTSTPHTPFDRIVVDTIGPLPITSADNKYAVTIICDLTKYIISIAVPNREATTVAKAILNQCILIYGTTREILTDSGTEYKNQIFREICHTLKIDQNFSAPYHHETVGWIERNHRTFNKYVRSYLVNDNTDWDELLTYFTLCYNTTPHTSFDYRYSPFELVFDKIPLTPQFLSNNKIDPVYNFDSLATQLKFRLQLTHKHAKELLDNCKIRNKRAYDKSVHSISLNAGDKVVIVNENRNKRDPIYIGPFTVTRTDNFNVTLFDPISKRTQTVNKNNMRKYK